MLLQPYVFYNFPNFRCLFVCILSNFSWIIVSVIVLDVFRTECLKELFLQCLMHSFQYCNNNKKINKFRIPIHLEAKLLKTIEKKENTPVDPESPFGGGYCRISLSPQRIRYFRIQASQFRLNKEKKNRKKKLHQS